jgi:probable F420-dependent oxidoreductase
MHGSGHDMLEAGPVDEVAAAAEGAGFDGLAFTEHPAPTARWLEAGGHQTLDPFIALAFAAAATSRIRLLTYLCVLPYRNALVTAKAAATIDKLSGGRFVLGVGTGYLKGEFRAVGADFNERNQVFDEALEVMPLHWAGEPFSYSGARFDARDTIGRPVPVQNPIPIWIGGNSALTRRRVAERAQGWMPLVMPPEQASTIRTSVLGGIEEMAGQIARIREAATPRNEPIDVLYPYRDASLEADPGRDVERHREAIARLEEAGVTWVSIDGATSNMKETLGFLERFGANYI